MIPLSTQPAACEHVALRSASLGAWLGTGGTDAQLGVGDGQRGPRLWLCPPPRGLEQRSVLALQTSPIQPCGWNYLGVVGPIPVPAQPPGSVMTTSPATARRNALSQVATSIKANILWAAQ